jgi:hypothetical protein
MTWLMCVTNYWKNNATKLLFGPLAKLDYTILTRFVSTAKKFDSNIEYLKVIWQP